MLRQDRLTKQQAFNCTARHVMGMVMGGMLLKTQFELILLLPRVGVAHSEV